MLSPSTPFNPTQRKLSRKPHAQHTAHAGPPRHMGKATGFLWKVIVGNGGWRVYTLKQLASAVSATAHIHPHQRVAGQVTNRATQRSNAVSPSHGVHRLRSSREKTGQGGPPCRVPLSNTNRPAREHAGCQYHRQWHDGGVNPIPTPHSSIWSIWAHGEPTKPTVAVSQHTTAITGNTTAHTKIQCGILSIIQSVSYRITAGRSASVCIFILELQQL